MRSGPAGAALVALWAAGCAAPAVSDPTDTDVEVDTDDTAVESDDTDLPDTDPPLVDVRALLRLPDHLQVPRIPDYNPINAERIALGRHLFYDRRLSGNQTQACADCHLQALGFADGEVAPTGSTGVALARNSPGLANVAWLGDLT